MIKNKILVITGMHRSGTSLITQWLNKCGLHVGDELMGAATGNDEGHFEDLDFLHAHQSILKGRRITDEGYTAPIGQLSHEEKDILNNIISYKNNFNQQWGWKDPRTCLFLDTYRQLIPNAFYFVVLRDPQSVVSSLVLRIYKRTVKKYASHTGMSKFIWEHFKRKRRMNMLL
ncbi:MAG: sulfotransferase, partial [Bacteroidota bacterium]